MSLTKIETYNPNYKNELFRGKSIENFEIYGNVDQQKIGSVYSILVDESGQLRYLVIDGKYWGFEQKVLLPIDRSRIDYSNQRVYALNLDKQQLKNLALYSDDIVVDYNYEERKRANYRPQLETAITAYDYDISNSENEGELYGIREAERGTIQLHEERLIANKIRQKKGEVTVGKTVVTEIARAAVPVEKERVIIEKILTGTGRVVNSDDYNFGEDELRLEVFEETAEIQKQTFVIGEVLVKKVVERNLVTDEKALRREELKIEGETDSHSFIGGTQL